MNIGVSKEKAMRRTHCAWTIAAACVVAGSSMATSGTPVSARQPGSQVTLTGAPFDAAKVQAGLPVPKMWTAQQDHQDMMEQLGIKALRPGPSGNEQGPITPTTTKRQRIRLPTCPTC